MYAASLNSIASLLQPARVLFARFLTFVSTTFLAASVAVAQTLPEPPGDINAENGDVLGVIGKAMAKAAPYLIIAVMIGASVFAAWTITAKMIEWRKGRADTGDVVGSVVMVIVLLAIIAVICVYALGVVTDNQGFLQGGGD